MKPPWSQTDAVTWLVCATVAVESAGGVASARVLRTAVTRMTAELLDVEAVLTLAGECEREAAEGADGAAEATAIGHRLLCHLLAASALRAAANAACVVAAPSPAALGSFRLDAVRWLGRAGLAVECRGDVANVEVLREAVGLLTAEPARVRVLIRFAQKCERAASAAARRLRLLVRRASDATSVAVLREDASPVEILCHLLAANTVRAAASSIRTNPLAHRRGRPLRAGGRTRVSGAAAAGEPPSRAPAQRGRASARQRQREATRRRLYEAAMATFRREGVERARLVDIAAAAGVSRPLFYAHFRAKEDVLVAWLRASEARVVGAISAVPGDAGLHAALLAGAKAIAQAWEGHRKLFPEAAMVALRFLADGTAAVGAPMGAIESTPARRISVVLADCFQAARERGELTGALSPHELANTCLVSFFAVVLSWCADPTAAGFGAMLAVTVRLLLDGARVARPIALAPAQPQAAVGLDEPTPAGGRAPAGAALE
jgi:AcrR family transcriptional regulator